MNMRTMLEKRLPHLLSLLSPLPRSFLKLKAILYSIRRLFRQEEENYHITLEHFLVSIPAVSSRINIYK